MTASDHIIIDPAICHGKPVIRGSRVPVTIVVGSLAGGMSFDDIQREYDLSAEDIRAALKFAGELLEQNPSTRFQRASTTCIAARARLTGAVLLTRDLDFANVRQYPPEDYPGLVVLRLPDDATADVIAGVIERFVREPTFLAASSGRLAIVEPDRVRFRPPFSDT